MLAAATQSRKRAVEARLAAKVFIDSKLIETSAVDERQYCSSSRAPLVRYLDQAYDPRTSMPRDILQVGVIAGATFDKYLKPSAGSLSLSKETHSVQAVGLQYVALSGGLTFELPLVVERRFSLGTTKKAKWCLPTADVVGNDGSRYAAEMCDERPMGPLQRRYKVQAAAYAGWTAPQGSWRVGLGPVVAITSKAPEDQSLAQRYGVEAPLYVASNLFKKDLKGLLRISIGVFRDKAADGEIDRSVVVSIAVLSAITVFPSVFDQF